MIYRYKKVNITQEYHIIVL